MENKNLQYGAIIRQDRFKWYNVGKNRISYPISNGVKAENIIAMVAEIAPGEVLTIDTYLYESIIVIFQGKGIYRNQSGKVDLNVSSCIYNPPGENFQVTASIQEKLVVYIWQSKTQQKSAKFQHNTLFNEEFTFRGFKNNGKVARMNFLFWPGSNCYHLCLHCDIQQPGESFEIHQHSYSEELFIVFEGHGEAHIDGEWFKIGKGDILYCPPGILHGTRNPNIGADAKRFVICGGLAPYDSNFMN